MIGFVSSLRLSLLELIVLYVLLINYGRIHRVSSEPELGRHGCLRAAGFLHLQAGDETDVCHNYLLRLLWDELLFGGAELTRPISQLLTTRL